MAENKIMIVDDEPANRYLLENMLSDYDVTSANDGNEMWKKIESFDPSLILMDVMLPDRDGFQLAMEIAAHEKFYSVPLIFLTARTDPLDVVKGFELGGYDYIKKPFNESELLARIKSALKKSAERERLSRDVIIDALTGLYNRRYLEDFIKRESNKIKRNLTRFSVAIIDIDFFKKLNDTRGHQCGDYVLKEFSYVIKKSLRIYDIPVRFGGEEFLIILPSIDRNESFNIISRVKKNNAERRYFFNDSEFTFTFTCGISDFDDLSKSENEEDMFAFLLKTADSRLYQGKTTGRDKIIIE